MSPPTIIHKTTRIIANSSGYSKSLAVRFLDSEVGSEPKGELLLTKGGMDGQHSPGAVLTSFSFFTILLLHLSVAAGYTCYDETVSTSPIISNGEDVIIEGCTFRGLITIPSPASVTITSSGLAPSTFQSGLSIVGDGRTALSAPIILDGVQSAASQVLVESIIANATTTSTEHGIIVNNSNIYLLKLDGLSLHGAQASMVVASTTITRGFHIINSVVDSARLSIVNSTLVAKSVTIALLLIQNSIFDNAAQLLLQHTILSSGELAIFLRADANFTMDGSFNVATVSMFRQRSVFNFTNATISGKSYRSAFQSYESISKIRRIARFDSGSLLWATDSQFDGEVVLFLREGSTALLDQASYRGINLDITGDSAESIIITIPATISVERLDFANCRVSLPELGGPSPTANTWDVRVTRSFIVGHMEFSRGQTLLLQPGPATEMVNNGISLHLSNMKFLGGGSFKAMELKMAWARFAYTLCSGSGSGIELIEGSSVGSDVTLQTVTFVDNAQFLVNASSTQFMDVRDVTVSRATISIKNSTVSGGLKLRKNVLFADSSLLSIKDSLLHPVGLTIPSILFEDTQFSASTFCVARSRVVGKGSRGWEVKSTSSTLGNTHVFFNGSSIQFTDSSFESTSSSQMYLLTNDPLSNPSQRGLIGGVGDRDSKGTQILFSNTTVGGAGCQLYLQGNGTVVVIDTLSLAGSSFMLHSTSAAAEDLDAVVFHLPPRITTRGLDLKGGSVRWHPPGSSTPAVQQPPPDILLQGMRILKLQHPLDVRVAENQTMTISVLESAKNTLIVESVDVARNGTLHINALSVIGGAHISNLIIEDCLFAHNSVLRIENLQMSRMARIRRCRFEHSTSMVVEALDSVVPFEFISVDCRGCSVFVSNSDLHHLLLWSKSNVRYGGKIHLINSRISAKDQDSAMEFSDFDLSEQSIMVIHNTTFTASRSIRGQGIAWTSGSSFHPGTTMIIENTTIEATKMALAMPPVLSAVWSDYASTIVLENAIFTNLYDMTINLQNGSLVFGDGIHGVDGSDVLVTGLPSFVGCSAASSSICPQISLKGEATLATAEATTATLVAARAQLAAALSNVSETLSKTSATATASDASTVVENFNGQVRALAHCTAHLISIVPAPPTTTVSPSSTLSVEPPPTESGTLRNRFKTSSKTSSPTLQSRSMTVFQQLPHPPTTVDGSPTSSFVSQLPSTTEPSSSQPPQLTTAPPSTTHPPPSPTPVKPTKNVKVTTILGGSETEAEAVTSTAGATSMVGASLGSSGGGVAAAISAVKLASCDLLPDGQRPEVFELPVQFPIGDGPLRWFVGAVLAHSCINAGVFALLILLRRYYTQHHRVGRSKDRLKTFLSMFFTGLHTFFTPNIAGACMTVIIHEEGIYQRAIATLCLLTIIAVFAFVLVAIHRSLSNGVYTKDGKQGPHAFHATKRVFAVDTTTDATTRTSTTSTSSSSNSLSGSFDNLDNDSIASSSSSGSTVSNSSIASVLQVTFTTGSGSRSASTARTSSTFLFSGRATLDLLLPLFEGCRDYRNWAHRSYTSVEVGFTSLIAIIAGARPSQHCSYAAYATCIIAGCGILYIAGVRPYRTYMDTIFGVISYTALVVLCVAVAVTSSIGSNERSEMAMSASLWVISVGAYVHLVVQVVWSIFVQYRRQSRMAELEEEELTTRSEELQSILDDAEGQRESESSVAAPLLVVSSKKYHARQQRGGEEEENPEVSQQVELWNDTDGDGVEVHAAPQHNPLL